MEIAADEALSGDIVVYLDDDGTPKHAGKIASADKRIKSKWGGGLFLEHGLWEVPQHYGDHVRYFELIATERAEKAFIAFCKTYLGFEAFCEKHNLEGALR